MTGYTRRYAMRLLNHPPQGPRPHKQTPPGCVPARYLCVGEYVESEIEPPYLLDFTVVEKRN